MKFSIFRIKVAVCSALIASSLSIGVPSAYADDTERITEWVREARQAEARGDYNDAGNQYWGLLNNEFNMKIPYGIQTAVGRRAVACFTIAARKEMNNVPSEEGWSHCEAVNMLERCWREMQKLEPNSPTWPYLLATRMCSQGRYADARLQLQSACRTTGGQPSVRKKAQMLLGHINKFASIDQARMTAADKAAVQALMSGQFMTSMSSTDQTSSSSGGWQPDSISDSERRARNAENAGDSGAAARFRSGGTTVQDHSRYW